MAVNKPKWQPFQTFMEVEEFDQKESVTTTVDALGLTLGNEPFSEGWASRNNFLATGMTSIPFSFERENNSLVGLNYTVKCSRPVVLSESMQITGVTFESADVLAEPAIRVLRHRVGIRPNHVVFSNCTFVRQFNHGTRPLIEIEEGARVVFVGCRFLGLSASLETEASEAGMVRVVSETSIPMLKITAASPTVVFTATAHGFSVGDNIFISNTIAPLDGFHTITAASTSTPDRFSIALDSSSKALGISNITNGGTGGRVLITTASSHGKVAGDRVFIFGSDVTPDINGDQLIVLSGASNTMEISTVSTAIGSASDGDMVLAPLTRGVIEKFSSKGATGVQFVGCSRLPDGGAYTTHTSDVLVTKTGCI